MTPAQLRTRARLSAARERLAAWDAEVGYSDTVLRAEVARLVDQGAPLHVAVRRLRYCSADALMMRLRRSGIPTPYGWVMEVRPAAPGPRPGPAARRARRAAVAA